MYFLLLSLISFQTTSALAFFKNSFHADLVACTPQAKNLLGDRIWVNPGSKCIIEVKSPDTGMAQVWVNRKNPVSFEIKNANQLLNVQIQIPNTKSSSPQKIEILFTQNQKTRVIRKNIYSTPEKQSDRLLKIDNYLSSKRKPRRIYYSLTNAGIKEWSVVSNFRSVIVEKPPQGKKTKYKMDAYDSPFSVDLYRHNNTTYAWITEHLKDTYTLAILKNGVVLPLWSHTNKTNYETLFATINENHFYIYSFKPEWLQDFNEKTVPHLWRLTITDQGLNEQLLFSESHHCNYNLKSDCSGKFKFNYFDEQNGCLNFDEIKQDKSVVKNNVCFKSDF